MQRMFSYVCRGAFVVVIVIVGPANKHFIHPPVNVSADFGSCWMAWMWCRIESWKPKRKCLWRGTRTYSSISQLLSDIALSLPHFWDIEFNLFIISLRCRVRRPHSFSTYSQFVCVCGNFDKCVVHLISVCVASCESKTNTVWNARSKKKNII